jgi:uncharacterized protein (DUF58 family)
MDQSARVNFKTLRSLIHRRMRYRITRTGALFVLAVALTALGAFLTANNLLFLIFSAMVASLLVSGFVSRLVLSGLELELLLPEHVSARAPAPARVRIRNLKRLTPSFSIELSGRPDAVNKTPSILGAPLYFPLIPGHGTIEASIEVTFPWRGRHRENLFEISTRFPFGFLRKSTIVPLRRETIVYPSLEPHEGDGLLLDEIVGEVETSLRGAGLDFYRIRPYETTDNARLVDWKTTAHTGTLQVREFSQEQQRVVEIFLDRRIQPGRNAWFEKAVEQCAFVVWHLADRGTEIWFRSQRFSFAIPDDGEVFGILRFLALIEPMVGLSPDPEDVESPLDPASTRLAFSDQPADFEGAGWVSVRSGYAE